jgi:hypothetical protein
MDDLSTVTMSREPSPKKVHSSRLPQLISAGLVGAILTCGGILGWLYFTKPSLIAPPDMPPARKAELSPEAGLSTKTIAPKEEIKNRKLEPPPAAVNEIKFSRGQISKVIQGFSNGAYSTDYVLEARAGQRMSVRVVSPNGGVIFDLYPQNDRKALLSAGAEDAVEWIGFLPVTGKYMLSVYSTGGTANYSLEITIQ